MATFSAATVPPVDALEGCALLCGLLPKLKGENLVSRISAIPQARNVLWGYGLGAIVGAFLSARRAMNLSAGSSLPDVGPVLGIPDRRHIIETERDEIAATQFLSIARLNIAKSACASPDPTWQGSPKRDWVVVVASDR